MKQQIVATFALALIVGLGASPGRAAGLTKPKVDFARDIRPILAKNCFACHGPDEGSRAAGLRLDLREAATGKRALVPGAPERSSLILRVTAAGAHRMPPPAAGPALTAEQVGLLRTWVQQGATYTRHWAWEKPRQAPLPPVADPKWARNPIDRFILARLQQAGLKPAPEADRFTLLRRVSLDLRGLPPSPDEVNAFASDTAPGAYERAVDRFLADPAYGERWARMWLDLARYADSAGYGSDPLRLNIWPYRDYVIRAFNENKPYDQFTREQIAGDLLPNATLEQKIATAFHRNTMTNTEGGTDDEEFRVAAVRDRVDTTLQVWMGLTMGCAKCHTHKYDPIAQKEYYQMFAVFNQTADADRPDEAPLAQIPYAPVDEQIRKINQQIEALKAQLPGTPAERQKSLQDEIQKLEKSRPAPATVPVLEELPAEKRRESFLLIKSNFLDRGEKVDPGVLQAFHPLPQDAPRNRLGVAEWLVNSENPLTARVAVNRFWAQLFGTGIVETEEDFGTQGELPSHPELLDWLAVYFQTGRGVKAPVMRPWDVKGLLKLIVTSSTYRQSAQVTPDRLARDPRGHLLSRAPRYRLEAEMVRDQALMLSGLLSRKRYGPSVYPPQPEGLWQAAFNGQRTWTTSTGEDRYRRGLYTFWRRTSPYPSMAAFDVPSREVCAIRRVRTNTPLQAFITLNDPVYVEAAQALARRVMKEGGSTPEEKARFALQLCLCRPPSAAQVKQIVTLYQSEREHYGQDTAAAKELNSGSLGPLPVGADPAEAAAWTVVGNVLLNLDSVLTKG